MCHNSFDAIDKILKNIYSVYFYDFINCQKIELKIINDIKNSLQNGNFIRSFNQI